MVTVVIWRGSSHGDSGSGDRGDVGNICDSGNSGDRSWLWWRWWQCLPSLPQLSPLKNVWDDDKLLCVSGGWMGICHLSFMSESKWELFPVECSIDRPLVKAPDATDYFHVATLSDIVVLNGFRNDERQPKYVRILFPAPFEDSNLDPMSRQIFCHDLSTPPNSSQSARKSDPGTVQHTEIVVAFRKRFHHFVLFTWSWLDCVLLVFRCLGV